MVLNLVLPFLSFRARTSTMSNYRIEKIIKAGSLDLKQVVEARVYLTDLNDYDAMNTAYREYFGQNPPTRATVVVPQLPGNNRIGMTFVAAKSRR